MSEGMAAGAEMDAAIFTRVLGEQITCSHGVQCSDIPPFSVDLDSAWIVVERLREMGINLQMDMLDPLTEQFDRYTVEVGPWSLNVEGVADGPRATVQANTAPLAICRAALRAAAPACPVTGPGSRG